MLQNITNYKSKKNRGEKKGKKLESAFNLDDKNRGNHKSGS